MSPPAAASEDSHKAGAQPPRASVGSVWLKPERFEASDFSPDLCVSDLRRYVSIWRSSLCAVLHVYGFGSPVSSATRLPTDSCLHLDRPAGPVTNSQGRTAKLRGAP
jgi:hypothetical protein